MLKTAVAGLLALVTVVHGNVIVYTQDTPHTIMSEFLDMPADFGGDIPLEGLRGFLVQGVPSDGCTNLTRPPAEDNFTGRWIVLIAKHNCTFEQQIRNAQAAGYDCAIVHNVNSSELEIMTAKNPDGIDIPSVFVSDLAGNILAEEYLYTSGFYIMVNDDLPFNINTHLLLPFAIVVLLCLLVILIFMIVKCIKDRRRARRHCLPSRALAKIPTCKFSKGDPYETCAICLDDYADGDKLRVLPCAHAYHSACIDPWLTQNKRVCPVCKRRVFAHSERRRLHTDSDTDDDTEPLLNDEPVLSGTFDEQSENPFARATRFMAALRARSGLQGQNIPNAEVALPPEDNDDVNSNNVNDENGNSSERGELVRAEVVSETTSRRQRERERRAAEVAAIRRLAARTARGASARHQRTRARSQPADTHSINTTGTGEIGVAAIPAPASNAVPPHVQL